MQVSKRGIGFLKREEGFRADAYQDVVGVWTIGFGSTTYEDGTPVQRGDKITETDAEKLLRNDLNEWGTQVQKAIKVPISQAQYDALMSFVYNVGIGAFLKSTLLKKINAGDFDGAVDQFTRWIYATDRRTGKKRVIEGLVARRAREAALFAEEMTGPTNVESAESPEVKNPATSGVVQGSVMAAVGLAMQEGAKQLEPFVGSHEWVQGLVFFLTAGGIIFALYSRMKAMKEEGR